LEQRLRELERREANVRQVERLYAVFQAVPFSAMVVDPVRGADGSVMGFTIAGANAAAAAWLRLPAESLRGQAIQAVLPSEFIPSPAQLAGILASGKQEEAECRVTGPAGTAWYWRTIIPVSDGLLLLWQDISPQRRLEAELREREDRFRRVIQYLPCLVMALDEHRKILVWNQQCERATGYASGEIVGNPRAIELLYPDPERRQRMLDEWKVRGKNYDGWEWTIRAKDGRDVTIAWYSNHGRYPIPGWASWAVGIDVTERHLAEQREKLELEARLQQVQKMESIGLLAGGIAHDFNNLLSPIMGFAELALSDAAAAGDTPSTEGLRQILKAAERGMDLTRRLLAFSRKQVLDTHPLDLNEEVSVTAGLLRRVIGEDIEVTLNLEPDLGKVRADSSQIQQVLMNLALNARDAMPDGGKLIIETANVMLLEHLVRGFPGVKPGPYVMLTVSDTGQGMDEQVRRRIFEPFFTTKEQGRGTGLGLAIVLGIVQQHGGHIEVDSQQGLGTTFKLYLPHMTEPPAHAATVGQAPRALTGRETVLVAEDEPAVRQMACKVLQTHGYTVIEAPDGPTAERLFKTQGGSVRLLLTDVMMPEMNGMELYRRLSRLRSDLKVLFMTGYPHDLIERYGKDAVALPVLNKPFTIARLTQKVREVLDG
jgi:hypothetical protein